MNAIRVDILCTACGADTFVRREPEYDGFKKIGERFLCGSCGHQFADESQVPFKQKRQLDVFSDADIAKTVEVFHDDERERNCRHCTHYVVNPFTQWCGLHRRDIEATDICEEFTRKNDECKKDPDRLP